MQRTAAFAFAATAALGLTASLALAQDTPLGPLVSPAQLKSALEAGTVQVIDIRAPGLPEKDGEAPAAYAAGHLPGAVNAPYGKFRGPKDNPGQVPDAASLTQLYRGLGLTQDAPVVITYAGKDATDFGAAARVYWTLKSTGFQDISILNGGVAAWTKAGEPLVTDTPAPQPSTIEVSFSDQWMATAEDVQAAIDSDADELLLDARPESFWKGNKAHDAAARPGTLPQSRYFEHAGWFSDGPAIVDAAAARRLAQENGLTGAPELISFCNTGHWAATNWFALSELAGLENVKLYPESMVGWSNAGREMANVPGPIRYLWNQIFGG